jgi:hypothetical protein
MRLNKISATTMAITITAMAMAMAPASASAQTTPKFGSNPPQLGAKVTGTAAPAPTPSPSAPIPVTPKDSTDTLTLLQAVVAQHATQQEAQAFIQSIQQQFNPKLTEYNNRLQAEQKAIQDLETKVKQKEGWGDDVSFDAQTGQWERKGAGAGKGVVAGAKSAPATGATK